MNSALQRARAGMREHLPAERGGLTEEDAGTRAGAPLYRRQRGHGRRRARRPAAGRRPLLDAAHAGLYVGRGLVVNSWVEDGFEGMKGLRGVLTFQNRQPAVAFYLWRKREDAYWLMIDVLRVTGGAITRSSHSTTTSSPRLGLPERLPADGTE